MLSDKKLEEVCNQELEKSKPDVVYFPDDPGGGVSDEDAQYFEIGFREGFKKCYENLKPHILRWKPISELKDNKICLIYANFKTKDGLYVEGHLLGQKNHFSGAWFIFGKQNFVDLTVTHFIELNKPQESKF